MENLVINRYNHCQLISKRIEGLGSAAVGVWLTNGVRHESEAQCGYAHFLEHLLFRRTKYHSGKELSQWFESMGGHINAETGRELTAFYGKVPARQAGYLLELLLEMLTAPAFNEQDFQREKGVVLQELAMLNDDPEEALEDFATEQVWCDHSMGRQILGTKASLKQATMESVYRYLNQVVCSGRLTIIAVGAHDVSDIESICRSLHLPACQAVSSKPPLFRKVRSELTLQSEQTHLQWLMPAVAYSHERAPVYEIANHMLAGGYDSRLYQALREEAGLVYTINSRVDQYADTGLWFIQTNTDENSVQKTMDKVNQILRDLIDGGPTEDELRNARRHLQSNLILETDDIESGMEKLAQDWIYHGEIKSMENKLQAYEEVTVEACRNLYRDAWRNVAFFAAK